MRARPGESTRFGIEALVQALVLAAADVKRAFPGGEPLRIGDLSSPRGGRHSRHGSHRTGRDADLIFYATDPMGHPIRGRGWVAFDRFGTGRDAVEGTPANDLVMFDVARNWHLVRTLVLDAKARVQWIFCSRGIKHQLLRYAMAYETSSEALFRASWVLHQPSQGRPHSDHFHIRVLCGPEQRALGCRDRAPIWPWLRKNGTKPAGGLIALDDETAVHALMSDDGQVPGEGAAVIDAP